MGAPGQSVGQASGEIGNFIRLGLGRARFLSSAGANITSEALTPFGYAMHSLTDMGDPMHMAGDTPITYSGGLRETVLHVMGEIDESVDWLALGQTIRLAIAGFSEAFPDRARAEGNIEAWTRRAIGDYVSHYFSLTRATGNPTNGEAAGRSALAEDRARQCALGNPAACDR
jgi:hypothetical protein